MESRKCTKCKKNKNGGEINGMNRMCIECLDKQKESNTAYCNQKEVFCDICQRNVRQKEIEEYLKDDEGRIAKLKQIWKTITPKHFKRLYITP